MAMLGRLLVVVLLAVGLSACGRGGRGESSCAAVLRIDGHLYDGSRPVRRDPETTDREVPAVQPACDDTGPEDNGETDTPVLVAELTGVSPSVAVYWHDLVYLRRGATPPPQVRQALEPVTCGHTGPVDLTGIVDQHLIRTRPDSDGERRPHGWLELHATGGPESYRGTRLDLRVGPWTTSELAPGEVGRLEGFRTPVQVRVRCAGERFRLTALAEVS